MRPIRLAAVTVLISLSFPIAASASAHQLSFSMTFEGLAPGLPVTQTATTTLARDAQLRELTWISRSGILDGADLEVEICTPAGDCVDAASPGTTVFPAGQLTVVVTATLGPASPAGGTGQAVGHLVFFADSDGGAGGGDLPLTGADLLSMVAWGVALVCIGSFFVALARRDRDSEESLQ